MKNLLIKKVKNTTTLIKTYIINKQTIAFIKFKFIKQINNQLYRKEINKIMFTRQS